MTPPRDPRHRRAFAEPTTARDAAAALEASVDAMRAQHREHGPDVDLDETPPALLDEPPTGLLDLAALRAAIGADTGDEPVNPAAAAWLAGEDPEPVEGEIVDTMTVTIEPDTSKWDDALATALAIEGEIVEHTHPYFVEGCGECLERAEQLEQLDPVTFDPGPNVPQPDAAPAFIPERSPEPKHECRPCSCVAGDPHCADNCPGSVPEPLPSPAPAAPVTPTPAARAFIPERSPAPGWRSRHDPRSRGFGVRRQFTGSVPVHDVVLPVPSVPLHQGAEDSCVGAAITQAENVLRLLAGKPAALTMRDASAAYHWAQRNDSVPGENYAGTDVNAGMLAGRSLGYWPSYSWSFGTRDIAQTVMRRRPVVVGVPWLSGMQETGPGGLVELAGEDVGIGHALVIVGIRVTGPGGQPGVHFGWLNSRGLEYGDAGVGWIAHADLARLLHGGGEAATPDPAATS